MRKRSIALAIATISATAYAIYLFAYFIGGVANSEGAAAIGGAIATALVTPHAAMFLIGAVFGWLGVFLKQTWAALTAAIYIVSGARGMERGTLSEEKNPDGSEHIAYCELVRLALPRRVFTLSQIRYLADRLAWLYDNRHLIGGLRFVEEPEVMRFFIGRLEATSDWQEKLVAKFKEDFGESL